MMEPLTFTDWLQAFEDLALESGIVLPPELHGAQAAYESGRSPRDALEDFAAEAQKG